MNVSSNIEDALDGFFGNMIRSQPQSAFLQPVSLAEGQKRSEAICKIAREGLLKVYSSQQVEDCIMEISRFMSLPIDPNQIEKKNTSKIPTINKLDNMTPEVIEKINEITTYDRNLIDMLSPWFPEKG